MRPLATTALSALLGLACNPDPYPGEQGAVMHVGLRLLPKTLDPPDLSEEASSKLAAQVYEGLLETHPFARPYTLTPALAEALPDVSEDERTYTFRIRKGVSYSDDPCFPDGQGRDVTAYDLEFALKRFSHPGTLARSYWMFDGWVEGLTEWRDGIAAELETARAKGEVPDPMLGLDRPVPGFEVVDEYTFRFHLTRPYPQFLWLLAMPQTAIYPREAVEFYGDEFRSHPVGTGPFRLTEFDPVYRAVFARNDQYRRVTVPDPKNRPDERWAGWEEDEAAGLLANAGAEVPLLDGIEVRFILEDQPRWLYFKNGHLDFMIPPKDNVTEAIVSGELSPTMAERGITLHPWTELGCVYTALNTKDPLLSNVDVRRAVALATDVRWTIDNLYSGQAIIARSPIPPGVAGFDGDHHPYQTEDGSPDYDRARSLLSEAGYDGGIDPATGKALRLRFESSGTSLSARHFAGRFVDDMRRIGIEVDVIVNTFPQLTDKMRRASYQVAGLAWNFDYPDAQNILQLLYGPNEAPGINSANFKSAHFDELYERASTMPDSPERSALYAEMAHIVADEIPWITRVHRIKQNLQQPWLVGFKFTETTDQFWRYVAIDTEQRDRLRAEWNQPTMWPVYASLGVLAFSIGGTMLRRRTG